MTLPEIKAQIQVYLTAGDVDGILSMMILENIQVFVDCIDKPLDNRFIPIEYHYNSLGDYMALRTYLNSAATVNDVLIVFTGEYLLPAQVGREYEAMKQLAEVEFTAAGFTMPEAEAETRTQEYYQALDNFQNDLILDPCL